MFVALILSVPLANQLHVVFPNVHKVYQIRERPGRIYSWAALVTSQILVEIPLNHPRIDPSFVLVLDHRVSDRQGGYTYPILGVLFLIYYTTIGKAVAAISPTAESAGILFSFLFSFVLAFDGVVQPVSQLGWWRWVYGVPQYMWNSFRSVL